MDSSSLEPDRCFFLVGFDHSPPLDDLTPLSWGRRLLGVVCLILAALLIPPIPI